MSEIHVCFSVMEDCINLMDSYGEICVHCNCCGRFGKETMHQARINVFTRLKKENDEFEDWWDGAEELQRKNVKENSEYYAKIIAESEKAIAEATNDQL